MNLMTDVQTSVALSTLILILLAIAVLKAEDASFRKKMSKFDSRHTWEDLKKKEAKISVTDLDSTNNRP